MYRTHGPSSRSVREVVLVIAALVATTGINGCSHATEPIEQVRIALTVSPGVVAAGDTVAFTTTAINPTGERVQLGTSCGPSFDVLVTAPDGRTVSVLGAQVGTCELGPYHFVDPGATQTLQLRWRAPTEVGVYRAVTGLRRNGSTLARRTASVAFEVR
jgi:hypothetical protein